MHKLYKDNVKLYKVKIYTILFIPITLYCFHFSIQFQIFFFIFTFLYTRLERYI